MEKDFNSWNEIKKQINKKCPVPFFHKREIWWCSLGLNIGSEEDGKNELFERPVLILKVLNKNMVRVVPLTSKVKHDTNHLPIDFNNTTGTLKISQLKTISTKRLTRKLGRLDDFQFGIAQNIIRRNIV